MISILLSCYRTNLLYLKEQIDSIIHQTEQDWELLVYDDGSEFLSFCLNEFNDNRIKLFEGKHLGYAKAYNFLLGKAKGEYICFCDHDDIWRWDKLETEKKYLDEHPLCDCVFGLLYFFGDKEGLEQISYSDEDISKELLFWQPVRHPSVMFRKNKFREFNSPYDCAGDYWFWSRHFDRNYHLIPKIMVNYRKHPNELTKNKEKFRENAAKIIQTNLSEIFGKNYTLDDCKKMDKYSKTYDKELKESVQKEIWALYKNGMYNKLT